MCYWPLRTVLFKFTLIINQFPRDLIHRSKVWFQVRLSNAEHWKLCSASECHVRFRYGQVHGVCMGESLRRDQHIVLLLQNTCLTLKLSEPLQPPFSPQPCKRTAKMYLGSEETTWTCQITVKVEHTEQVVEFVCPRKISTSSRKGTVDSHCYKIGYFCVLFLAYFCSKAFLVGLHVPQVKFFPGLI